MTTSRPNQSMMRGLRCLELLAASPHPMGSREIARELNDEHTRVNRALGTLVMLGLAERTPDKKYQPGPAVHVLAAQSLRGSRLLQTALPHLEQLRADGFTVALGVLWEDSVCYLLHARPEQTLIAGVGSHELVPASSTSLGRVLLASRGARLPKPIPDRHVSRTTSAPDIRSAGYAEVVYDRGDVSVAAPIGAPPVAAIGVSKLRMRPPATARTGSRLIACARSIAASLERGDPLV